MIFQKVNLFNLPHTEFVIAEQHSDTYEVSFFSNDLDRDRQPSKKRRYARKMGRKFKNLTCWPFVRMANKIKNDTDIYYNKKGAMPEMRMSELAQRQRDFRD